MNTKNNETASKSYEDYPAFGIKDKVAYMFGDFGNDMTFILQSSFLMIFYTNVIKIPPAAVGTLFLVARIVDAFTDTAMGRIVDSVKVSKDGKFKPWIRRMAIPVALASFLMYQSGLQNRSMSTRMIYMYVTYLLWGSIFYTSINIPYGSMASSITSNPDERTELSTWRTRGATLASLIIGSVVPLFIYDSQNNVKTDNTFTIVAGVLSILAVIFYAICYKGTNERVYIPSQGKQSFKTVLSSYKSVLGNRSLIGIILASLFLIMGQLMLGSMNPYVFPMYYNSSTGLSILNMINPLMTLFIVTTTAPAIAKKIGKKELSTISGIVGGLSLVLTTFIRPQNPVMYIIIVLIGFLGIGYFNTVIWANIIDVIDDVEVKSHVREDGTIYGLYSFARKIGQALAGAGAGYALGWIGYNELASTQTTQVLESMFTIATLVPGIALLISAACMIFIYPLDKKKVDDNAKELASRRVKKTK